MNFILLHHGYPPIIIKTENKGEYLTTLQKADAGDLLPFVDFLVKQLHWSLDLSLRAAQGLSIDEAGDIDKQIELLKRRLNSKDLVSKQKDSRILELTIFEGILPMLELFEEKCQQLSDLFIDYDRSIQFNIGGQSHSLGLRDTTWKELKNNLKSQMDTNPTNMLYSIDYRYTLKGFKKSLSHQYMSTYLTINFNEFNYSIGIGGDHDRLMYAYDEVLDEREVDKVVKKMIDNILDQIKNASGLK